MGHLSGGCDNFGAAVGGADKTFEEAVGLEEAGAAFAGSDWGGAIAWGGGDCIIT